MPDKVYIISRLGHPLMPCSPAKARHLLDDRNAGLFRQTDQGRGFDLCLGFYRLMPLYLSTRKTTVLERDDGESLRRTHASS